MDSSQSSYRYVGVDGFTPNSGSPWTSFGAVSSVKPDSKDPAGFIFTGVSPGAGLPAPVLKIQLLGPAAFRVRFNPRNSTGDYSQDGSYAVVNRTLGPIQFKVLRSDADLWSVALSPDVAVRLDVRLRPFSVQVYRNQVLISADEAQGLVYLPSVPGAQAVANFKRFPANAHYFGFGEKAGNSLDLSNNSMTFFNYDNYKYSGAAQGYGSVVPDFSCPGPLNSAEPLYNSIPFLIEDNPNPKLNLQSSWQRSGALPRNLRGR